jgi:hypothetical protein
MKILKLTVAVALMTTLFIGCTKQVKKEVEIPKGYENPDKLTTYELNRISEKIYMNETSGKPEHLMFWSTNEVFPSLGIGHFIWYPKGQPKRFDETFPAMIQYYIDNKVEIPEWLRKQKDLGAPWANRATFERSRKSKQFIELKYLLMNTKNLQTQFFFDRLKASLPEIAGHVSKRDAELVKRNYNVVAKSPGGWYPLIDYINFKGKGIKSTEKYNGQGWGLLQVLQTMRPINKGSQALMEFSRAADAILKQRVRNSPPENNEKKWLKGWKVRTDSYAKSIL